MDIIGKLNDRNLSLPERCILAASLINQQDSKFIFPRKNQHLFDWLTGTLIKLSRSESPKPEIFLNKQVWGLLKVFSDILAGEDGLERNGMMKRSFSFITDDEEFFDYRKSFDATGFVIKCPILSIFQTCLSLLGQDNPAASDEVIEVEVICSVISAFFKQNRVSLPVSFSQATEFIRSLVLAKPNLSNQSYAQILESSLSILGEIILGGSANYKKTYPLLVKFCLQSAAAGLEDEIWIEFMRKCLFPNEFTDELLGFMLCPSFVAILHDTANEKEVKEASFPKSLTFQRALFIDLANDEKAASSSALIYESFLRAAGPKIDRESGFNFFSFLFRRTLMHCRSDSDRFDQLAKLISILQARGNEIYQQRNDQIYRDQSAIIEQIFMLALGADPEATPFPLLLSLAQLNYYLISEKLESIFDRIDPKTVNDDLINFVLGMFGLAAIANQLPVLLEMIVKSNVSIDVLAAPKLQAALASIFRNKISPSALNLIFIALAKSVESEKCVLLLIPVVKSIYRIIDEIETFDASAFARLQSHLLSSAEKSFSALVLLTEIVRWTPGTSLLLDELFQVDPAKLSNLDYLNLMMAVKCKDPSRVPKFGCLEAASREINLLLLKYLPMIAGDLNETQLEAFSAWLLGEPKICRAALKRIEFFEIRPLQGPFLNRLIVLAKTESSVASDYILALPADYISDGVAVELIKCCWNDVHVIKYLLETSAHLAVRSDALKSLYSTSLDNMIELYFSYSGTDSDFVSKCVQIEHSSALIDGCLERIKSVAIDEKMSFLAKLLKYADFDNEALLNYIKKQIDPLRLLQQKSAHIISVRFIDHLDVILGWISDSDLELIAACILSLPDAGMESTFGLEVVVRCQSLRCKFPARADISFIEESINLASRLSPDSAVGVTFKKDLLSMIKDLPTENVNEILRLILFKDNDKESSSSSRSWKLSLGLQALLQLLNMPSQILTVHQLFTAKLTEIYRQSLVLEKIPAFLAVLKSIIQVKKNITWDSVHVVDVLGVLRKARQAKPEYFEDIFMILRFFVTFHLRGHKSLTPLLVATICEAFADISELKESVALGRVISELGALRRGEIEPFSLLPLVYAFSSTKFSSPAMRKPVQLAMNNILYHLSVKYQLMQFLSSALIYDHEHRVLLKSFLDEYNKFHKYSGGA